MSVVPDLRNARDHGARYIFSRRGADGMWRDFPTRSHGWSDEYATAYVGVAMLDAGFEPQLYPAADALVRRQRANGGWGFNKNVLADSDTTAFAAILLSELEYKEAVAAKELLRTYQNSVDGSFSTYAAENARMLYMIPQEGSVAGWAAGHPDPTASCLRALREGSKISSGARKYLERARNPDGSWHAYWFNDPVFATAHAIFALKENTAAVRTARAYLERRNRPAPIDSAFYAALSLDALAGDTEFEGTAHVIAERLVRTQKADGSWEPRPTMRFPTPDNLEPWKNPARKRDDFTDTGIFTTAECVRGLSLFLKTFE